MVPWQRLTIQYLIGIVVVYYTVDGFKYLLPMGCQVDCKSWPMVSSQHPRKDKGIPSLT